MGGGGAAIAAHSQVRKGTMVYNRKCYEMKLKSGLAGAMCAGFGCVEVDTEVAGDYSGGT